MTFDASPRYDVAIVGAGPVGSVCALAFARKGARVVLLEANPDAPARLAGEWLHPPAVKTLREIGIDIDSPSRSTPAAGFVVFPDDGSDPIELPYPDGSSGVTFDHALLVSTLREAIADEVKVDFISHARVNAIEDERVCYSKDGSESSISAVRVVGADGRASIVRRSLDLSMNPMTVRRCLGSHCTTWTCRSKVLGMWF